MGWKGCVTILIDLSLRFSGTPKVEHVPHGEGYYFLVAWYQEFNSSDLPRLNYVWGANKSDYESISSGEWTNISIPAFTIPAYVQIRIAYIAHHNDNCTGNHHKIQLDNIVASVGKLPFLRFSPADTALLYTRTY